MLNAESQHARIYASWRAIDLTKITEAVRSFTFEFCLPPCSENSPMLATLPLHKLIYKRPWPNIETALRVIAVATAIFTSLVKVSSKVFFALNVPLRALLIGNDLYNKNYLKAALGTFGLAMLFFPNGIFVAIAVDVFCEFANYKKNRIPETT